MPNHDSPRDSVQPTVAKLNQTNELNAEQLELFIRLAKEQAARIVSKIPVLGAVTWLMMQQTSTKHSLLSELDWRVMPALALDQAKLYTRENLPVAYVSWAKMSEASVMRYKQVPHQLTPSDWKSGDQIWLIDFVTPFGGAKEVLSDLRTKVFPGRTLHQLIFSDSQQVQAISWPASGPLAQDHLDPKQK